MAMKSYSLVTPARDEAAYIPGLIECILKQTVRPTQWIIVSDGSTDQTDNIVSRASKAEPFIELIRVSERSERSFGSKALAFMEGYKALQNVSFNCIGNLDADVTMEPHYYQRMLEEMAKKQQLGVASGVRKKRGKPVSRK